MMEISKKVCSHFHVVNHHRLKSMVVDLMPFDRTVTEHIVPIDIIKWLEILWDIDFS